MRNRIVLLIGLLALAAALLFIVNSTIAGAAKSYNMPMKIHGSQDPETPIVPGSNAKLVTNKNGAAVSIDTNFPPGHAVTLWWVVINNPSACAASPCTGPDILFNNMAIEAQITYGGGHVVDEDGQFTLGAHLNAGPLPGGWFEGQGFTDPTTAEIHVVLNDHEDRLPDYMPNMIQTYRGGCTDESLPPPFPDSAKADGVPGPNTCRLAQFAIFEQE